MGRFRIRLTCQTSPTRQTSTRCVVGFLKSGFNGFNWCAFWKSTSQQVNELLRGRIFEDSKFRVFEDSIFSMGVGEGVKKIGRKRGGALPSCLGIYLRLSSSFFLRSGFLFFSGFFLFVGFWHFELVARVEHVGILQLWISLA